MNNVNEVKKVFEQLLENYIKLEKYIYDSFESYNRNPEEEKKQIIVGLCGVGKRQIEILGGILPKVCEEKYLVSYQEKFKEKYNILSEIANRITNSIQK